MGLSAFEAKVFAPVGRDISAGSQGPFYTRELEADSGTVSCEARTWATPSPPDNVDGAGLAPWQVKRVRAYIAAHLADRISLAQLSELVRLSASHFGRGFRRSFGQTFVKFLLSERIDHAKHLMLTTKMRLGDIAQACGFADQSHFSRAFRRQTDLPPAQWRRRARTLARASATLATGARPSGCAPRGDEHSASG